MKARRIVGIVSLILAVAGIACGIWGLTNSKIAVSGASYSGVFDLSEGSFDGSMGFSTAGGFSASMSDVRAQAERTKNLRTWGGFGAAALFGIIGVTQLLKTRREA